MSLLTGCVCRSAAAPRFNAATRRVFDRAGVSLTETPGVGCCGALAAHLDAPDEARALARRNIAAWEAELDAGAEAVVVNASGCAAFVRDYPDLMADVPAFAGRARRIAEAVRDPVGSLRTAHLAAGQAAFPRPASRCTTPAPWPTAPASPAPSPPCSPVSATSPSPSPRRRGAADRPAAWSLLHPRWARRLRDDKLAALTAADPEAIYTGNIGCWMHLGAASPVPVRHWIEAVDEVTLRASPRRGYYEAQRLGDGLVDDAAALDVEALGEPRIVGQGLLGALAGQGRDVGRGGGAQRIGRGQGRGAGHVGDAVVDHVVDHEGGIGVGGRMAGLEAAALVDGDVHQHRAGAHPGEIGPGHELGRRSAGDQDAADHQVGRRQGLGHEIVGGVAGLHGPPEQVVQFFQARRRYVEQGHVGAVPQGHLGSMLARDPAAQDQHPGRKYAGRATQQKATTAGRLEQMVGAHVHRHASRDLAHGGEERQASLAVGYGLIGDGGAAGSHQAACLVRVGGQGADR